jgi:hypothetical protein
VTVKRVPQEARSYRLASSNPPREFESTVLRAPGVGSEGDLTESTATDGDRRSASIPFDLVIEIENEPGSLARVAAAVSDAGVNLAAATCIGTADQVELHILVPHAEAARHALAISQLAVSREREVVVIEAEDRPGVLADLTRKVAHAGIDLDLVYVATRNRLVFGAADLAGLKAALGQA